MLSALVFLELLVGCYHQHLQSENYNSSSLRPFNSKSQMKCNPRSVVLLLQCSVFQMIHDLLGNKLAAMNA